VKTPRPKVLWVLKELGRGGSERLLLELLPCLGDYEIFPVVIGPYPLDLLPEYQAAGLNVRLIHARGNLSLTWLREFRTVFESVRPDIIHVHSPQPAAILRVFLPHGRTPFVYTEHSLLPSHHPLTRLANVCTYFINDAVITVSDEVRDSVAESFFARRVLGRTRTVHNGIDVERVRMDAAIGTDQIPEGAFGAVTHLTARKGADLVVEAARILKESGPERHCVLVGSGPMQAELKQRTKRYGLELVQFLGVRSDARALMAELEVVVIASRQEGLPLVLLEAMALGRGIVATRAGGIPEVLEHEKSGLLVDPEDPYGLAEAINRLFKDVGLRESLGKEALEQVRTRWGIDRTATKLASVYRSVLSASDF
jgi:glycosyltransferase involved in cell wall biosynthesis